MRPAPLTRLPNTELYPGGLPGPRLRALYARQAAEIAAAGLGASWDEFRAGLAAARR